MSKCEVSHRTVNVNSGDTLIVGVGSVGRPLDGPGAAYVIYDDGAERESGLFLAGGEAAKNRPLP